MMDAVVVSPGCRFHVRIGWHAHSPPRFGGSSRRSCPKPGTAWNPSNDADRRQGHEQDPPRRDDLPAPHENPTASLEVQNGYTPPSRSLTSQTDKVRVFHHVWQLSLCHRCLRT